MSKICTKKKEIGLIFFILLILIIRGFFINWYNVPSDSMYPLIERNTHIFINQTSYSLRIPFTKIHLARWDTPKRGDVVVFYDKENTTLVKRVMAVAGDTIKFEDGDVYLNGQKAEYVKTDGLKTEPTPGIKQQGFLEKFPDGQQEYIVRTLTERKYPEGYNNGRNAGEFKVPEGHVMMIGDNRDNSADSRFIGFVPVENIIGKVINK